MFGSRAKFCLTISNTIQLNFGPRQLRKRVNYYKKYPPEHYPRLAQAEILPADHSLGMNKKALSKQQLYLKGFLGHILIVITYRFDVFLQVLEYQARELQYEEELSSRADKIRSPYIFYTFFRKQEACTRKRNFFIC